ncbi:beta-1,3-galactosyl-O-glycosyl-glycoprotein beta-1,6-N-acetylglucosaminyltransferase-like [Physella acuta]|uniref:beta-1,3-galactosyl-O-glycosyl-glycoprotein beta-1,6-N-acetylglucosaminyltransferase-like n=1 Tax=Physella acuta TaxID=109671 RepID=UPI0027DB6E12|nr:beta-1,3-galactosyl-O-glycosyl-glycoprotein beta-1,6-N-acetylglucosaminyltransferase-like [Physella acuta]
MVFQGQIWNHVTFKVVSGLWRNKQDVDLVVKVAEQRRVPEINCSAIFAGDIKTTLAAREITKTIKGGITNEYYISATKNCPRFIQTRGYINSTLTKDEEDFPIAFSVLVFKDAEMVERLLRAIYRPQNVYCIHVDKKSGTEFYKAISSIAGCFSNVFLTARRVDVRWGTYSVLEPELLCMQELWRFRSWRYFINLTGQEFPLRTNYELVKILRAFKGANSIHGTIKRANVERWGNLAPPLGIRAVKGSVHIAANRHFVDYILHNSTAEAFLNWTKRTRVPDETFFASLNYNPQLGIKGSFTGEPDDLQVFLTRYKIWADPSRCAGKRFQRSICILSTGDLPHLGETKKLFANKFYLEADRLVIGCLEERLSNRTRDQYMGREQFDVTFYSNQTFVTEQVT